MEEAHLKNYLDCLHQAGPVCPLHSGKTQMPKSILEMILREKQTAPHTVQLRLLKKILNYCLHIILCLMYFENVKLYLGAIDMNIQIVLFDKFS